MKNYINKLLAVGVIASTSLGLFAQNTRSGYFVEDYTFRYQMNPAYGNSKRFVSMPGLGNVNVGMQGTLGVSDVLYNVDGKTTTFLNPGVSAQEVMDNIGDGGKMGVAVNIPVLAAGFHAFKGYNTVTIGVRSDVNVKLPGEIFSLMKNGISNQTYNIGGLKANANLYAEIALNHSHQITEDLRVGGTFKFLLGGGNVVADMREATLELGENDWRVTTDADVNASVKGWQYKTKTKTLKNSTEERTYVNGVDIDGTGLNGFGIGVDLGAIYKTPVEGLTVSASVNDLGFISWNNNVLASTGGKRTFNTDRYTFNFDDDADNSFKNEWDIIQDDLTNLYEVSDMGDQGGRTTALNATMNIGVEYALPSYKNLTFGLLNTTRFAGDFTWTDFRLSANVAPCKIFSGGVNLGVGTYGVSFGFLANLHMTGFNLFVGMDRVPGKLAKQGVPLNSNMAVNLGLNFPF